MRGPPYLHWFDYFSVFKSSMAHEGFRAGKMNFTIYLRDVLRVLPRV